MRKNDLKFNFICFTLSLLTSSLSSCSKSLDEPGVVQSEDINGFRVEWRSQIAKEQKTAATQILENMIYVEGDYFMMGAMPEEAEMARRNEYPLVCRKLSGYYICKYEISDEQYFAITNKSKPGDAYNDTYRSFDDWNYFIIQLKDLTGINFSFPTEAQWEFAAKGGKLTQNYIYPGSNNLDEVHSSDYDQGSYTPNELGIYNLADLKSEWCLDMYGDLEDGGVLNNWLQTKGDYHVVKGGNFLCNITSDKYHTNTSATWTYHMNKGVADELDYRLCRISARSYGSNSSYNYIGCRLVINIGK